MTFAPNTLEFVSRTGFALLFDLALKSTLVLALALAAERLLRRRSAALRHLVLVVGLAAACALPFAERLLPRIPTPFLANITPAISPEPAQGAPSAAVSDARPTSVAGTQNSVAPVQAAKSVTHHGATSKLAAAGTSSIYVADVRPEPIQATLPSHSMAQPVSSPNSSTRWPVLLPALWMAGLLFFGL